MCMVPDLICSSSVNMTGVLFVYWLYGVFELFQLGNNCLFGRALFIFIYFDLCKLVPIGKLLPFWVEGPLMCVVVCNRPNRATFSPLGSKPISCFFIHSFGSNSLFYPQM